MKVSKKTDSAAELSFQLSVVKPWRSPLASFGCRTKRPGQIGRNKSEETICRRPVGFCAGRSSSGLRGVKHFSANRRAGAKGEEERSFEAKERGSEGS